MRDIHNKQVLNIIFAHSFLKLESQILGCYCLFAVTRSGKKKPVTSSKNSKKQSEEGPSGKPGPTDICDVSPHLNQETK
jgi:hypothetical protein